MSSAFHAEPHAATENAMADMFDELVAARRSVRAFLPDPVPQEVIARVFTAAGRAPSNCNAQPWVTHLVSGPALQRVRAALMAAAQSGTVDPDFPLTSRYVDHYKERRIAAAVALFEATGIGRHDQVAREASFMRNFAMFNAPHAAFFYMSNNFGMREAADIGMYAQTLMLALTAHGLGSCAQGALGHHGTVVRRALGVDADLRCLFGVSFGYADESHPSVAARTDRAPLSETLIIHDR